MKITVKTFWICMVLLLTCNVSGKAIDLIKIKTKSGDTCMVAVSSSLSSATSNNVQQRTSSFTNTKFTWTADMELGSKPFSENNFLSQQRLRRVIEDNLFLRNILLILSHHQNLIVHDRSKLYYSDKDPYYALTGSDYYIYTLRQILI